MANQDEYSTPADVSRRDMLTALAGSQKDKVRIFGGLLRNKHGITISQIFTHREIVDTRCPGRNMQPFMEAVRQQQLI